MTIEPPNPDSPTHTSSSFRGLPLTAVLFLLLSAALSLTWSHHKLLSQDEIFALQTDSVPTLSQLIHIQRHTPISLDPLVSHALAHAAIRIFGANAFALRLPSFLGYLLMQICLFFIVRRLFENPTIAARAAIFALAFPTLTATFLYSAEGRPYGLLLGLYALTFLTWQTATRRSTYEKASSRLSDQTYGRAQLQLGHKTQLLKPFHSAEGRSEGAAATTKLPSVAPPAMPGVSTSIPTAYFSANLQTLALLTLTIALTLNTHYFGLLLLIPLYTSEILRTLHRRHIDIPIATAILLGTTGIVFALPFRKAAAEFRLHYYNGGEVSLRAITQSYRALFVDYTHLSLRTQHYIAAAFVAAALALILASIYRLKSPSPQLPRAEILFTLLLAALPFFGYLLALAVTHSIEVRYVLGAIIGITVLLTLALTPIFRSEKSFRITIAILFVAILTSGLARIHAEARTTQETLTALIPSPALKAAILASPTQLLYIQNMGRFEVASYYEPDAFVRSHMALLYSSDEELRWNHHDTESLTALHMRAFTGFPIISFEQLKQQPGPHILILSHTGWDWTDPAFAESNSQTTPLGHELDGDAVSVR